MIPEGSDVRYVGDGVGREAGLALDDRGRVVSSTPTHSHVSWRTGALAGNIALIDNLDLVAVRTVAMTDDSLDTPIVAIAARQVYEEGGAKRLLGSLVDGGHTSGFAAIAEEVFSVVASRIRQDPSFRAVLAQLDGESGDDLVSLASISLLRDAFDEVA